MTRTDDTSISLGMAALVAHPPDAEVHLRGAWLRLARAACAGVALISLVMWLWGIPYRYAQYAAVCVATPCGDQQPTPAIARALHAAGLTLGAYSAYMGTVEALYALAFMAMAALIFWRRSDTVIGLLTTLLFTTQAVTQTDGNALASAVPLWRAPNSLVEPLSFIAMALFLYLFPDGRFTPRWTRIVAVVWVPLFLGSMVALPTNTFLILLFSFIVISLGAQVYRYRHQSSPVQRQQTKWVVSGVMIALLGSIAIVLAGNVFPIERFTGAWGTLASNTVLYALGTLIPISIGVSITRSHLWDLDTLINKALVYGLLSATLAALFAGLILGLETLAGRLVSQSGLQPLALVISTLAVVALVQPLRRRIQTAIDQRFYRSKYNASRTLETFGATLRSEVELGDLSAHLVTVVEETMQPERVSLWLRPAPGDATHDAAGR